jgi:hypothetical protein
MGIHSETLGGALAEGAGGAFFSSGGTGRTGGEPPDGMGSGVEEIDSNGACGVSLGLSPDLNSTSTASAPIAANPRMIPVAIAVPEVFFNPGIVISSAPSLLELGGGVSGIRSATGRFAGIDRRSAVGRVRSISGRERRAAACLGTSAD